VHTIVLARGVHYPTTTVPALARSPVGTVVGRPYPAVVGPDIAFCMSVAGEVPAVRLITESLLP
jgi:hypothetical protein